MNLTRLGRQLQREMARNPKKAAVLGLLCLVALWFWGPIVWNWLPASSPGAPATAPTPVSRVAPEDKPAEEKTTTKTFAWHVLEAWIAQDPRMNPVVQPLEMRNPFLAFGTTEEAKESEPQSDVAASGTPVDVTPESLGLVLRGTIIGPRRKVAQINDAVYAIGDLVPASGGPAARLPGSDQTSGNSPNFAASPQMQFVLMDIRAEVVVLSREGKHYLLSMPARQPHSLSQHVIRHRPAPAAIEDAKDW